MSGADGPPTDSSRNDVHIPPGLRQPCRWTVVLTLTVLSACASTSSTTTRATQPESTLLIRVRNENPLDARVYLVLESLDYRLGTVTAFRTASFRMPLIGNRTRTLRIRVVPIGGGLEYMTEPIVTGAIEQIDFRIANPFAHSAIFVR
jgi:hypothetical protein